MISDEHMATVRSPSQSSNRSVKVAGVDGTKRGWVAVVLEDGRFDRDAVIPSITSSLEELGDVEVIGIDVPIGFGKRAADDAARRFLAGAASTVFSTPTREVLEAKFRAGLGVSAQSHALGPRIIHVTALAATDSRIHEVHPEASFREMNAGRPLGFRKKSAGGAFERITLLQDQGIDLSSLGDAAASPLDDVLDAAAAAWSAHRIARHEARSLPDPPEQVDGRQIAIWV